MHCTNCGAPVEDSWKHCKHCGTALPTEVIRQEALAVGKGLSEGIRSGAPFSEAELRTQGQLVQDAEAAAKSARAQLGEIVTERRRATASVASCGTLVFAVLFAVMLPIACNESEAGDDMGELLVYFWGPALLFGAVFLLNRQAISDDDLREVTESQKPLASFIPKPLQDELSATAEALANESSKLAEMERQVSAYRRAHPDE